ncbi:NAD(P)H-dependent oxidoreductase [Deinococcus sp. HMF7604]|uniref:NAD(P)H-dependent oxidoreductase n=1 Tax=Deinococcus betulae TaxID=2873312 RepID=UPI001CCA1811|nr:NAD(P)H-dependent oxidoreductase [Deinococcus betulae]MBZ9749681.1 NAD(P)H-dependent oxidoreductase [Deinococcus betulae]
MSTLVINAHPNPESFCRALAESYAEGAGGAGAVGLLHLADLHFDPVLHRGYQGAQPLEPDLVRAQALVQASTHLCVVYPVWWGAPPALLKSFVERTFLPGFAFQYRGRALPDQLLRGRSARLLVTSDSPAWYLQLTGDSAVRSVKTHTLGFSGFRPVRTTRFGPIRTSTPAQRERWLRQAAQLAAQDQRSRGVSQAPIQRAT